MKHIYTAFYLYIYIYINSEVKIAYFQKGEFFLPPPLLPQYLEILFFFFFLETGTKKMEANFLGRGGGIIIYLLLL